MNRIRFAARAAMLVAPFACAVLAASSAGAAVTDHATAYGIASFGGPLQCGTPGMTHPVHLDTANAFNDQFFWMKQVQFWGSTTTDFNYGVGSNLFTDATRACSNCTASDGSSVGIDRVAVSFLHTHASHNAAVGNSSFSMGNSFAGNTCNAATDTNLLLGDTATPGASEIAVMKACQGADLGVWQQGGYKKMVQNSSRFSMWNGFHGDSSCGGATVDYVTDYASSSFVEGAGENWIDDAFESDNSGDDCPVSIVFGNSKANRKAMFTHGGFGDRKLTGVTKSGSTYFFVAGCTPPVGTGSMLPTQ